MLKKLMKYEFQATGRYFLPMYLLLLVFAALTRLMISLPLEVNRLFVNVPTVILAFGYVAVIVSIYVMTLVITIQRFYKNLLSDEGYLMFTLPVKPWQHIWSKLIVAFVWMAASAVVTLLSIFVFVVDGNFLHGFPVFMGDLWNAMVRVGPHSWLILLLVLLVLVTGTALGILQIYASIVVGSQVHKHKLLAGIGCYLGFNMVQQLVMGILFSSFMATPDFWRSFANWFVGNGSDEAFRAVELMMLGGLLFCAAFCAGFYLLTHQMLKRRLNLE